MVQLSDGVYAVLFTIEFEADHSEGDVDDEWRVYDLSPETLRAQCLLTG